MTARLIELDASGWASALDFYEAILRRLGAPPEHGMSVDALVDSIIWGGMNKVEPPYTIRIQKTGHIPNELLAEIMLVKKAIEAGRSEALDRTGRSVDVELDVE